MTPGANNTTDDNPYQYVGRYGYYTHYQEPTFDLLQLGVRFYDPQVGRFTQVDPAKDGLNWYLYGSGNPIVATDPTGLWVIPNLPGLGWAADKIYHWWFDFYFTGGGRRRTLRELRVYDTFWNSSQVQNAYLSTINSAGLQIYYEVAKKWSSICRSGKSKTFRVTLRNQRYAPNFGVGHLLPLGHSNVMFGGHCKVKIDCCKKVYFYRCNMQGRMWDAFEDVRDIGNTERGNQELPGGTAYDIEDTWSRSLVGCGSYP